MSDPTGGNELLVGVRVERQGAEVLPQVRQQVVQFDQALKGVASTSGPGATMLFNLNREQSRLGQGAPIAARGLTGVRNALSILALEATGATGPVGTLASRLLLFSSGSTLALGVAAGVGAIAFAYKLASAEATKLQEASDRLNQTWRDLVATGHPTVGMVNDLTTAIGEQTAAQDELDKISGRKSRGGLFGPVRGTAGEIALAQNALDAAARVVTERRRLLGEAQVQLAADAQGAGLKTAQAFIQGIKFLDPQVQLQVLALGQRQFGPRFRSLGAEAGELYATAWLHAAQGVLERDVTLGRLRTTVPLLGGGGNLLKGGPGFSPAFQPEKFAPREFFLSDLVKEGGKERQALPDPARLAAEAIALLGALKQGGAAEILGASGEMLSELSGLKGLSGLGPIGIGATVLSGLVGIFSHQDAQRERNEERRHRELLGTLHEGFLRVTFINADGTAEAGLYEMRRAERLGGEPRLGGI